tara:strand:+ start:825 stop:1136 length:312 start_codon:yes stop_codon:yes gene_type:complete
LNNFLFLFAFLLINRFFLPALRIFNTLINEGDSTLRDDYLAEAQKVITDPMVLVNVVSRRAKQLKNGYKPLVESLERLSAEDMALREIIEGKINYQLDENDSY